MAKIKIMSYCPNYPFEYLNGCMLHRLTHDNQVDYFNKLINMKLIFELLENACLIIWRISESLSREERPFRHPKSHGPSMLSSIR